MCWKSQSLQTIARFDNTFHIRVLVLELPAPWFKASPLLVLLCLTRDYRECSRYSRISVGTPELQFSNMFTNALNLSMMHDESPPSEFRECSEDSL